MVYAPLLPRLSIPPLAPWLIVVAPDPKLIVVALASNKEKLVVVVVREVIISGLVLNTETPVPVSSVRVLSRAEDKALVTKLLDASVNTALLAVRSGVLIIPVPLSSTMLPVVPPPNS